MRHQRKRIVMAILIPVLVYALYAGVMYGGQLSILFPGASSRHHAFQGALPPNAALVEIPVSFGKLRAIYLRSPSVATPGPAIIFAHGNFDRARDYAQVFQPLVERGIAVLALEYPGYDGADGRPDANTLGEAASSAYDWLARQPQVDPARIVGMGYSMGGGVIAELSRHRALCALALLSTYTSIADVAHRYGLPSFLARLPYDNVARVRAFAGPVFIEHGRRDRLIPFVSAQILAHAATHATFVALDCGHDTCDFAKTVFASRLPAWLADNGISTQADRRIISAAEPALGATR